MRYYSRMDEDIELPVLIGREFKPTVIPEVIDEDIGDGINRSSDLKCYPRPRGKVGTRKFNDTKKQLYVQHIAAGGRRVASAKAVGVSWACVWMAFKEDVEFAEAVMIAETLANEHVENAVYNTALNGDVRAQQYWLNNRWPERWRNERHLNVDADVNVTVEDGLESKFAVLAERMLGDGEDDSED